MITEKLEDEYGCLYKMTSSAIPVRIQYIVAWYEIYISHLSNPWFPINSSGAKSRMFQDKICITSEALCTFY